MTENQPVAITISRQLGSGGSFIGQKLASHLNSLYLDREILSETAKILDTKVEILEARDERILSLWQSFINSYSYSDISQYQPVDALVCSDKEIFRAESEIIQKIAQEQSVVIIGRGAFHILKDHPRHVSIYLHADIDFRLERIKERYKMTEERAKRYIEDTDKSRAHYIHALTGRTMSDARGYDLVLDTGKLGLENTEKMILDYLKYRFEQNR